MLGVLAVAIGYILGWANRAFHVHVDPRQEAILNALPSANCGACGLHRFVVDYAEAVVAGKADATLCAPGGRRPARGDIAAIMGVEVQESWPYRPVVHCAATTEQRLQRHEYLGERTCGSANLVAGVQGLHLRLPRFSAIVSAPATTTPSRWSTACRKSTMTSVSAARPALSPCPRNVISMVPWKASTMLVVACSNKGLRPSPSRTSAPSVVSAVRSARRRAPGLFSMKGSFTGAGL